MPRMLQACAWALLVCTLSAPAVAGEAPPLTLEGALALALASHPGLEAATAAVRASEAEALQAGRLPNPTLNLELENFAGSGDFSGTSSVETTLRLDQTLELGGKRNARSQAAATETALARRQQELSRAELTARTKQRFFAVLATQQRLALAEELTVLARRSLTTVEDRIAAGQAPATEALRARLLLAELEIDRDRETRTLAAAGQALAELLGDDPVPAAVAGELRPPTTLPSLESLRSLLAASPQSAQGQALLDQRRQSLALERARTVPDLELGIGIRHFSDSDDQALVAGLSLPLPLFDRNQGAVAAARSRIDQARAEQLGAVRQAETELVGAWQQLSAARHEALTLQEQVLPAAEAVVAAAEYGYRAGKFPLLDVLDAQRTLIEARQRHLAALAAIHQALAELERLLGRPVPGLDLTIQTSKEDSPS